MLLINFAVADPDLELRGGPGFVSLSRPAVIYVIYEIL